jgi:hypothetical protein
MELLIYVPKITPRINYTFRQICKGILGFDLKFTTKIETFIGYKGVKFSYTKQRLGNEVFIQSFGLLEQQGVNNIEIDITEWDGQAYFFKTSQQSDIPFDIFSASFYLLSRYEEYLPHVKNELGDFPFEESVGYKHNFLEKPVINIWMNVFYKVLNSKFDQLDSLNLKPGINLIIGIEKAFKYRGYGISRSLTGFITDIFRLKFREVFSRIKTWFVPGNDPYDVYDFLVNLKKNVPVEMLFMFQLGDYSIYTKNISYRKTLYKRLIKSMGDYSEIGLMVSHEAIDDSEVLSKEIKRFENIANHELKSVLIMDRSINFPKYYVNLENTTIKKDFSMGYHNAIGFRTGTFSSHLFYDLNLEQASPKEIHPYYCSSSVFKEINPDLLAQKLCDLKNLDVKFNILLNNSDFSAHSQKGAILKKISLIKECLEQK